MGRDSSILGTLDEDLSALYIVWYHSFLYGTWFMHVCDMKWGLVGALQMQTGLCFCWTWLIHVGNMGRGRVGVLQMQTWLFFMLNMTRAYSFHCIRTCRRSTNAGMTLFMWYMTHACRSHCMRTCRRSIYAGMPLFYVWTWHMHVGHIVWGRVGVLQILIWLF